MFVIPVRIKSGPSLNMGYNPVAAEVRYAMDAQTFALPVRRIA
jgi:hypothetical protein